MGSPSQKNETQTRGEGEKRKSSLHKKLGFSNLKGALCVLSGNATHSPNHIGLPWASP